MNCLICDQGMIPQTSWRRLFCSDAAQAVCNRCMQKFEKINGEVCSVCGVRATGLCRDCEAWEQTAYAGTINRGISLFKYNEAMQQFLHRYKFLQDAVLARVFAEEIRDALKGRTVVPVPMNKERLQERTFSQVNLLLDAAGVPYTQYLEKNDSVQGQKTKQERLNAPILFEWNGRAVPKRITVVDDLYTTGTTMRHAAKVLRDAGAEEILICALIRS